MRVRQATVGDAAAIGVVHVRSWQAAYRGALPQAVLDGLDPDQRRESWERILAAADRPRSTVLVADANPTPEQPHGVVGFASVGPARDDDVDTTIGEVTAIYLNPATWGHGVGRLLMAACVAALGEAGYQEAILWVLETNDRARRFYEAAGWHTDGATKTHLTHGVSLPVVRYRRPL